MLLLFFQASGSRTQRPRQLLRPKRRRWRPQADAAAPPAAEGAATKNDDAEAQ